jgi:hypothetical protein
MKNFIIDAKILYITTPLHKADSFTPSQLHCADSKIKNNSVWINFFSSFGWKDSKLNTLARCLNFYSIFILFKRWQFFFARISLHSTTGLLFSASTKYFSLIFYYSLKLNYQYVVGWVNGLWSNRLLMRKFVWSKGIGHHFSFYAVPSVTIIFDSSNNVVIKNFLQEVDALSALTINFFSLVDIFVPASVNFITNKTMVHYYYYMELLTYFFNSEKLLPMKKITNSQDEKKRRKR